MNSRQTPKSSPRKENLQHPHRRPRERPPTQRTLGPCEEALFPDSPARRRLRPGSPARREQDAARPPAQQASQRRRLKVTPCGVAASPGKERREAAPGRRLALPPALPPDSSLALYYSADLQVRVCA
ncbi:uncharacterized protein LOC105743073 [Octodon degus]|uniref:Uncharacterized protein LOC105743073 n=1 Tax=Octodon degus TaxID=10160 RepID=A0A6P6F346_OCTDE|nr:uncharacterized protein LOC105743073 [Octodon degus]